MPHKEPIRDLPHAVRNGTLAPCIDHDTAVLKFCEKSEFAKSNVIDSSVADKLEQHLRFRQDVIFDVTRPGELDLIVMQLPARFFKDSVIEKTDTEDAAGNKTTADDRRTLADERNWTVPDADRTMDNIERKPTMKMSRPKSHPSSFPINDHDYQSDHVTSPHLKPYYSTLHAAQQELAHGDSAYVSSMLTGEESERQFSYMNELQETIHKIRRHRSMLLSELDSSEAAQGGTGREQDETHEAVEAG